MSEQPLDLKGFLGLVWRRRLVVGGLAAAGLACGVAHTVLLPPLPRASALVVIPPSSVTTSSGATVDNTPTQVIIGTSTPVLKSAGAAVTPLLTAAELRPHVSVSAPSPGVLQFEVSAPTASEAQKLTNAEVASYIAYVVKTGASSNSVLPALQQEAAQLTSQIQTLQGQINTTTARLAKEQASSAGGQRDASLIGSLRTEQEQVSLQLNNANNQIVNAQLSSSLSAGATRVLQPASLVPTSKLQLAFFPVVGAAAGLFAGCLVVFLYSRRDRRLRLRDELASALGLPVLASLESDSCKSAKEWKRLLEEYHPSPVDSWNFRRLLHSVVSSDSEPPARLGVIAFADDRPSLAVGVQLARCASELGMEVELTTGAHSSLALLRAACTLLRPPASPDEPFRLDAKHAGGEFAAVRLALLVTAVERAKPDVPAFLGGSLIVVSSGFATAEELARLALAASDSGSSVDGIVVVNPDPGDSTAGVVPQRAEARKISHYASHRPSAERSLGRAR